MNIWISIISGLLIVIGTLGAVLPFLPGLPVAWLGLLVYAWFNHFPSGLIWGLAVFGILIVLTIVVDVFAPAIAAKGKKASREGVWGAIIGGLLGISVLGPIGILIGPFVGAFIGEMISSANSEHALKIATASMFGLVLGGAFKLIVGTSMFIYFLILLL